MDVVIVFNGLGNQMSQYAFYLQKKEMDSSASYLAYSNQHNGLELSKVFNIDLKESFWRKGLYLIYRILLVKKIKIISRPIQRLLNFCNFRLVEEGDNYNFNAENLDRSKTKGITFYHGGWHHEKYFFSIKDKIADLYQFNIPQDELNVTLINEIKTRNSVSIHVRRGDYLKSINKHFADVVNETYYKKAIGLITEKVDNPHFFVFSNDIDWVKANLQISNVTYVVNNPGKDSWKDMYLMTICKHNIIANSSFSWWGAWLNKNPGKIVVSPNKFIHSERSSDIYPDSWIKLLT